MIGLLNVILAEAPGFLLIANFLKIAERAVRQLPETRPLASLPAF